MELAFELKNISVGYAERLVIENLSLQIAAGEMVAILGPNGAGKSTLLRALTGLLPLRGGELRLFGQKLTELKAVRRARLLGVVPQGFYTPMAYSVEELVMMGRTALLKPWQRPTASDTQIVQRALVYTDLQDLRERPLDTLSGGERQRALIAMVLAQEPRVIVMDEPTTHLDLNHSFEIMQIIERLNREQQVTILMISHDLNLASEFCRRLIFMHRGRVLADGTPREALNEKVLREVYQCDLRVREEPVSGALCILPVRRADRMDHSIARRVHVIAGGGSAGELLRRLALGGCQVSCGALNEQDSDAQTAAALDMELALEKPFSPIGPDALARACKIAAAATVVIVAETPFGPGNLVNLDLADQALARGATVLLNDCHLEERDFCGGAASRRLQALLRQGAIAWQRTDAVLELLSQNGKRG